MSVTLKTFDCALFYDKSYVELSIIDKKLHKKMVTYMNNTYIIDASGMQINMNNILDAVLDNLSWDEIQELVEPVVNEDSSSEYEPSCGENDEDDDCNSDFDDLVEESDSDEIVYERVLDNNDDKCSSPTSRVTKKRKI